MPNADNYTILLKFQHLCKNRKRTVIVTECYPGVNQEELVELLSQLEPTEIIHSNDLALPPEEIDAQIERDLTDDPVFDIMTTR